VSCKLHLFIHLFQSGSLILTGLLLCYACHFFTVIAFLYTRPKVVGPFPGPCASGSYVHRAALFCCIFTFTPQILTGPFYDYREDEFLCAAPSLSPLPLISKSFGDDVSRHLHKIAASEQDWVLSGHISGPADVFFTKVSLSCNC
jgi:hypothetical protein